MTLDRRQRRFYREKLVKHEGMPPMYRVMIVLPISIGLCCAFTFVMSANSPSFSLLVINAIVTGTVIGIVPVGLIMSIVVLYVRVKHALLWCFGSALIGSIIGLGFLGYEFAGFCAVIALCIAALGVMIFGPRYRTLRYAQCPGCKYNLALLPKSDVCPECGRDNRDLVAAFKDVDLKNLNSSS